MKNICMIGLGYIGLPTAIVAVEHGFELLDLMLIGQSGKN